MLKFDIIVAVDQNNGIGNKGSLPWNIPADMKRFKTITTAAAPGKMNAVIMGKNTYLSIGKKLPERHNIVVTKGFTSDYVVDTVKSLDDALKFCEGFKTIDKVFVIGGEQVFKEAFDHPNLEKIHLTRIYKAYTCDTFFPEYRNLSDLKTETLLQNISEKGSAGFYEFFQFITYYGPVYGKNRPTENSKPMEKQV